MVSERVVILRAPQGANVCNQLRNLFLLMQPFPRPAHCRYSYCALPSFMTCEAIFFVSAPRRPGILLESVVFMLFPLSFAMTAIGHHLAGYWEVKIRQVRMNVR
jgi:hypothetical protein